MSPDRLIAPLAGYDPVVGRWLWSLDDTRQRTLAAVDGLPETLVDWTPPEGGNSIGAILYHLAGIEMSYLYEDVLGVGWAAELEPLLPHSIREADGMLTPVRGESLALHLDRLATARALLRRALRTMTAAELRRERVVGTAVTTPEWIFHHLIQHEAEHRGQIGELRRRGEQARR